ncbi:MAG: hypothetical protein SVC26_06425 [Pseudomonadota bacterium]|nr:hypothetical protein [Pseudomonadota bacterium]
MTLTTNYRNVCAGAYYESLRDELECRSERLHEEALEELESFLLLEYAEKDCLDFIEDEPDCHLFIALPECSEIFSDLMARRDHLSIVSMMAIGSCDHGKLNLIEQKFVGYLKNYSEQDTFLTTQDCKDILSEMATKYDVEAIYEFLTERSRSSKLTLLDMHFLVHLDDCEFFSDYRRWVREQV